MFIEKGLGPWLVDSDLSFLVYQIKRSEWQLWIKSLTTRLLDSFRKYIQRQKEATHGRQECEPPCAPDLTPCPDRLLTCIRHTRARRKPFYHRDEKPITDVLLKVHFSQQSEKKVVRCHFPKCHMMGKRIKVKFTAATRSVSKTHVFVGVYLCMMVTVKEYNGNENDDTCWKHECVEHQPLNNPTIN